MTDILTEEDCLKLIHNSDEGRWAAAWLLEEHLGKSIERRFKKIDRELIKLLEDVQEVFPDACYYTASGGFHLMLGNSHDAEGNSQQELVAFDGYAAISDGDF